MVGIRRPRERRDAAQHRRQVLHAAERLFAERGCEAVTMDEIAQAAGVGKGTLYRRYGDKSQVVLALMDASVASLASDIAALPACPSALDELKCVMSHLVTWAEGHAAELGVIAEQRSLHSSPLYEWMHSVVLELLIAAIEAGEVRTADPVFTADALLALLDIDLYLFQRHQRGYSAAQIEAAIQAQIDGLRTHVAV